MTEKQNIFLNTARQVLGDEIRSMKELEASLGEPFARACAIVMDCQGRVILTGVGHSGHVGNKSAANMSSLCKPAYFLHAGEATQVPGCRSEAQITGTLPVGGAAHALWQSGAV